MITELPSTVTIRPAYPEDEPALRRLAALDSAAVPRAPFLLAEVEGELRAALSLADRRAIADPFRPTLELVALLRSYAAATAADARPHGRPRERRYRPGRLAPQY
jgi:hypothetical protein